MNGGDWPREIGRNPNWQEEESGREAIMDSEGGGGGETESISTEQRTAVDRSIRIQR